MNYALRKRILVTGGAGFLGNPCEFSMIELAHAVIELTGSSSYLVHKPLPPDDPKRCQPDIGLAREHLGWEPQVPLREGLKSTIDYFDHLLNCSKTDH